MNLYGVLRPDEAGNLYAFHTVWADYPFHTSVITSFVYSDIFSFPLSYPQFLHTEMHYPFLMDFYSAVLMKGGLDLRGSIIIPNILLQFSFFGLLYSLAYRLTGLKKVGMLATLIFIGSGFPPGLQSAGIHFLNPMYAVIMPQRTALFGMGISFVVYILLFQALFRAEGEGKEKKRMYKELFLAGTLIGLLPYIHAHSYMVTAFVSLFLSLFYFYCTFIKTGEKDYKTSIFLFAPLILLSLPQVWYIRTGVSENFFVFFPGWTEANRNMIMGFDWSCIGAIFSVVKTVFVLAKFWMLNMGILFFLLPLGVLKSTRGLRTFYLPFLLLFFIANCVKFQPWYFDNYKIFLHWLALTAILASVAIFWISEYAGRRNKSWYIPSLASLIVLCTLFGFVTHAVMIEKSFMVWSNEEIGIAEWVRENTPPNSIFLTGSAHNHPIPSLSGRQRVMGYEGWLWSHGINWSRISERKKDEIGMYKGNYTLIKEYGVDYVCIGPYERAFATDNHFKINYSAFYNETQLNLKYDVVIGEGKERWRIYEVKTPNIPA
ncbi:hypothetical protein DRN97_00340 [Methanosarcinales archaeon]|nr:MAG: hypothetical protein DRN97_00340 [Methanosarcinales archaeon]